MMARLRFCVVVLVFFALLRSASAQIVNVQPLLGKDLRDGWTVYGEGALDYRTGNVSLLQTTGSAVVRFVRDRHTVFLLTRGEYGVRNLGATNDKFLARHFEHVRYRLRVWRPYDVELFAQNDSDQFRPVAAPLYECKTSIKCGSHVVRRDIDHHALLPLR